MKAGSYADWPVVAEWRASAGQDQFAGHFPGQPVVPGAYLLDAAVACIEAALGARVEAIRDCKFLATVAPDELLSLRVSATPRHVGIALLRCKTQVVCMGTLCMEARDACA